MTSRSRRATRRAPRSLATFGLLSALTFVVCAASCGGASDNPLGGAGAGDDAGNLFGAGEDGGAFGFDASSHPAPTMILPINACPGALSASTVSALQAGGSHAATMKWLYPYDGTVFPGGIAPPILQWTGTSTGVDGVYVHLHSQQFDYKGCFGKTSALQLPLPSNVWASAWAQSNGAKDPLTVEVTTIEGGNVSGPISETWTFALGSLAGDVYYNTYSSKIVTGQTGQNGAVIKIAAGKPAAGLYYTGFASFPFGPCVSCQSLSSNGSMLVAQQHFYPGADPLNGKGSMSFDLTKTPAPSPTSPLASTLDDDWGLSAVFPDGSLLLTSGEPNDSTTTPFFPGVSGNNPGMIGPKASTKYNTSTGATIPFTGLTAKYGMMTMFSPDGKHVVYNDYDAGMGHTLTVMDFDVGSKTFSNSRQVFHDTALQGVALLHAGREIGRLCAGQHQQLRQRGAADPRTALQLSALRGQRRGRRRAPPRRSQRLRQHRERVPSFPGQDEKLDFYPTVNPVASGGYYWLYFTSRRAYGNVYNNGSGDAGSKSIWVSALDIDGAAGKDASHPAFYLPGQELGTGNIRAFAVLAPCKGNGASCESGLDCCGGGCTSGKCAPAHGVRRRERQVHRHDAAPQRRRPMPRRILRIHRAVNVAGNAKPAVARHGRRATTVPGRASETFS